MGIIFAILAGILMSIQGVFNTRLMESSSMWIASVWVHISAFLVCIIMWFFTGHKNMFSVFQVDNKLYLVGGIIGAFITFTVIKGIDKLGPAHATMLILLAQLIISYLIEVAGLFGTNQVAFQWTKLVGVLLMLAGIFIFKK
ncbi:MAG: DMT family transporter [Bacilli bacterium]|nr:DMT family transporter [Bacilli bacterium]MDD4795330.1 DMT family transporter [Bacilli bacterium]